VAAVFAIPALAEEKLVDLKKAPGLDKAERATAAPVTASTTSRSTHRIPMPRIWGAEITRTINAFGAPITESDAKEIADDLRQNYGS
jgi:hypothetical protein